MIKVRIGNDIRLNITLKGALDFDLNNVKQIKCYFVNTLLEDEAVPPFKTKRTFDRLSDPELRVMDLDHQWYSIAELDKEPIKDPYLHIPMHNPGDHVIDMCGPMGYRFGPWNDCFHHHDHYDPFRWVDPCWRGHCKFGHPCPHPHDPHCWHAHNCSEDYWACFDKVSRFRTAAPPMPGEHRDMIDGIPVIYHDPFYLAPCKMLDEKNRILVYFPAEEQYFCGPYTLIIELTTFEAGWGARNLRTRTLEYKDIVYLNDNSTGIDQDVEIEYGENGEALKCAVGFAPVIPPAVASGNADTTDQSFESANSAEPFNVTVLLKYLADFKEQDITTKSLTFNVDNKDTGKNNFLYVVSQRPVYSIVLGNSNISAPMTKIGEIDNTYYYAIPNSIAYTRNIQVTVFFERSSSDNDILGQILSKDACDCERISDINLTSVLNG